jgi:hypothetical protein
LSHSFIGVLGRASGQVCMGWPSTEKVTESG